MSGKEILIRKIEELRAELLAIDLSSKSDVGHTHDSADITYNNSLSGLVATTLQAAIDELSAVGVEVSPGGPAGGVLSGSYPNPDFAMPMADQAALDAHLADTQAHGISAFGATLVDDLTAADARTTLELGSASQAATTDFATAAQGATADSALQPGAPLTSLSSAGAINGRVPRADGAGGIYWGSVPTGGGGTGGIAYTEITADTLATAGNGYIVNAAANAVTLTLPTTPNVGDLVAVSVSDATNVVTVARNGNPILGTADDFTLALAGSGIELIWTGATFGWASTTEIGVAQGSTGVISIARRWMLV